MEPQKIASFASPPSSSTQMPPQPSLSQHNQPGVQVSQSPSRDRRNTQTPKPTEEGPTASTSRQEIVKLHANTSTPDVPPCGCPETIFYRCNQNLGAETRHVEFKLGGAVYDQNEFTFMVAKYMCGFLNSEGGTLYFGVDDSGNVVGISVDPSLEEELQEDIAYAAKNIIRPCVNPSEYSVNFARIMKPSGQYSDDMKVLEVCVKPRRPVTQGRYSCGGYNFIKRDGSLQRGDPLKPARQANLPPQKKRARRSRPNKVPN